VFVTINILLLVGLIKLLIESEKPFLCSGLYVAAHFVFGMIRELPFSELLLGSGILFALASLYFWLLYRIEMGTARWWVVIVAGLVIGLV